MLGHVALFAWSMDPNWRQRTGTWQKEPCWPSVVLGYRDFINDTCSITYSSIHNPSQSGGGREGRGEQSFLFSSITFFLSLAHTSCFSQQFWKSFRKRVYYQPLQMFLQLAPAAADPFPLGRSAPFRCPRLVPGASWYRGGQACLAVFLSFQEKFDIVVSFVRNVSLEKEMPFPSKKAHHKESPRRQKATSRGATWGQGLLRPSPV